MEGFKEVDNSSGIHLAKYPFLSQLDLALIINDTDTALPFAFSWMTPPYHEASTEMTDAGCLGPHDRFSLRLGFPPDD